MGTHYKNNIVYFKIINITLTIQMIKIHTNTQ